MKTVFFALAFGFCGSVYSQHIDTVAVKFANSIKAADLSKHLHVIASDEYEGRETGTEGQKKAANYIKEHFKKVGIPGGNKGDYFQEFSLVVNNAKAVEITSNGRKCELLKDYYYLSPFGDTLIKTNEVVFAGYGINDEKYDDYKDIDVKNKVVIMLSGEPVKKNGVSLITGSKEVSAWSTDEKKKFKTAQDKGAAAVLVVVNDVSGKSGILRHYVENKKVRLEKKERKKMAIAPVFYISKEMAATLIKEEKNYIDALIKTIRKTKTPQSKTVSNIELELNIFREKERTSSENVLGYIEGSDLKDELLVITAHYDHLGKKEERIYNGADDDGSGTVTVLELAEAFAFAKKAGFGPRRSILFMTVSGEEKGLLGSEYYSENPVYPLQNTVANLNIDMVGRIDEKHKENPEFIYLIGSDKLSTELHKISERTNATYTNLQLDYTYNRPEDPNKFYYRSDHYNFAKHNIPVIFYFNGTHDDYHKETDSVEKINFDIMEKRAKLVFYTAWNLVNRQERIKVDVENDFKAK